MIRSATPSRIRSAVLLGLALCALASAPARAQSWAEVGDAGELPATSQTTVGSGALTQIIGSFASPADADVYCIHITGQQAFVAGILCAAYTDPDIWLFDSSGLGVTHNDVCQAGMTKITGLYVPGPGTYYLAVAYGGRQALGPGGLAIWQTQLFTGERAPDGPGAPGPIVGWGGIGNPTTLTNYTINLQGVDYCSQVVPARGRSWGTLKLLYR